MQAENGSSKEDHLQNVRQARKPAYSSECSAVTIDVLTAVGDRSVYFKTRQVLETSRSAQQETRICKSSLATAKASRTAHRTCLSREKLEICRKKVLSVLRKCNDRQFLRLSIVVSCILHSTRSLHQSELAIVLGLLTRQHEHEDWDQNLGEEASIHWLEVNCEEIFLVDLSGYFSFADPALKSMFRDFELKGFDNTQRTIATACLECIFRGPLSDEIEGSGKASFLTYSQQNWITHYRSVQHSNFGLNAKVNQILTGSLFPEAAQLHVEQVESIVNFCARSGLEVLKGFYSQLLPFARTDKLAVPSVPAYDDAIAARLEAVTLGDSGYGSASDWSVLRRKSSFRELP